MSEVIFISYRREDSAMFASILQTQLSRHFLDKNIFKDVVTLQPGSDFKQEIESAIERSSVVLVLISKNWTQSANGVNRLFEENDFVTHEIKTAIEKNITLIPVLTDNVTFPARDKLPEALWPLCTKHSFTVHPETAMDDIDELIKVIRAQRKFSYEEGTLTGSYERLYKDPLNTLKKSLADGIEVYKKDFLNLKGLFRKKK